jgi:hypothetical protein
MEILQVIVQNAFCSYNSKSGIKQIKKGDRQKKKKKRPGRPGRYNGIEIRDQETNKKVQATLKIIYQQDQCLLLVQLIVYLL